jgi:hypothetical protein
MPPNKPIDLPGCTATYDAAKNALAVQPLNPDERIQIEIPDGNAVVNGKHPGLVFTSKGVPFLIFDRAGTQSFRLCNTEGATIVAFHREDGENCDIKFGDEFPVFRFITDAAQIDMTAKGHVAIGTRDPQSWILLSVGPTNYQFKREGLFINGQPALIAPV